MKKEIKTEVLAAVGQVGVSLLSMAIAGITQELVLSGCAKVGGIIRNKKNLKDVDIVDSKTGEAVE